jgi:hypothetical protein
MTPMYIETRFIISSLTYKTSALGLPVDYVCSSPCIDGVFEIGANPKPLQSKTQSVGAT